jgi:hypothetical protein
VVDCNSRQTEVKQLGAGDETALALGELRDLPLALAAHRGLDSPSPTTQTAVWRIAAGPM